ncbi:MAG: YlbF family regulator [Nitriliruptoraceae bacterium]
MQTTQQTGPTTVTLEAARRFAADLKHSDPVATFTTAQQALASSERTQALLKEYREAHQSLGWRARTGALEPAEAERLNSLQQRIQSDPHVAALQRAQDELREACQRAADILSETVGIDLASSCGPGGCG